MEVMTIGIVDALFYFYAEGYVHSLFTNELFALSVIFIGIAIIDIIAIRSLLKYLRPVYNVFFMLLGRLGLKV